jgi:hypothetical protein
VSSTPAGCGASLNPVPHLFSPLSYFSHFFPQYKDDIAESWDVLRGMIASGSSGTFGHDFYRKVSRVLFFLSFPLVCIFESDSQLSSIVSWASMSRLGRIQRAYGAAQGANRLACAQCTHNGAVAVGRTGDRLALF